MAETIGVIALARPTFDMAFAEEMKDKAFTALDAAGLTTVGPRALICDEGAAAEALATIQKAAGVRMLLILQITFTDASATVDLASGCGVPVAIWGVPEPRIGGRLRLNAFCGINLAAHALGKAGLGYSWLFATPDAPDILKKLERLMLQESYPGDENRFVQREADENADRVVTKLRNSRVSVIGRRPDGFDTCDYDDTNLRNLTGIEVDRVPLDVLFSLAKAAPARRVAEQRSMVGATLEGIDDLDQDQLDRSLRLYCSLQEIASEQKADCLAVRCWPETFTEFGCAACGPMAMMNEALIPSACEADVLGSVTTLMLQELAEEPVWMADMVDADESSNTAVLWHCGLAPLSMCDPNVRPEATIHTNRKMPLLHQFTLKPGRVTLARLSQSRNEDKLVIAGAEVLPEPMAFTGTSAVIRFDAPVEKVCQTILGGGLEHHYALAYGDHQRSLQQIASRLDIPVLRLT